MQIRYTLINRENGTIKKGRFTVKGQKWQDPAASKPLKRKIAAVLKANPDYDLNGYQEMKHFQTRKDRSSNKNTKNVKK